MDRLLNGRLPGIILVRQHLNELKSMMDEEVLRRSSFDYQLSLYKEIHQLECVIRAWNWQAAKQFQPHLPD